MDAMGKLYWSSEDFSTVANWAGGGCWGRILNQVRVVCPPPTPRFVLTLHSLLPQNFVRMNVSLSMFARAVVLTPSPASSSR